MLNSKEECLDSKGGLVLGWTTEGCDPTSTREKMGSGFGGTHRDWSQLYIKGRIEETRSEVVGFTEV